jgi:transposase
LSSQCYESRTGEKNFDAAHRLYRAGKSKNQIVNILKVSKPTVIAWLKRTTYEDRRGWREGRTRKYTDPIVAERICDLKRKRIAGKYFVGSEYVQMDYERQYPHDESPALWYIDKVVRTAKLQTRQPKTKRKGGSEYLLYPVQCIRNLGYVHQSADFIGKKYIAGQSEPVNIFSSSYYSPFKLYQINRILAEKAVYAVECWKEQWRIYPIPDVERLDNGLQFRGTASGKRAIGMVLRFLLNLGVTPLFGSPSKPWTNPHVEGHNRVFNEKVWGQNWFTALEQIDHECARFNQESLEYFQYKYASLIVNGSFDYLEPKQDVPTDRLVSRKGKKIYFTRFVESIEQHGSAYTAIMNERIPIPEKFTHQFVFVEWDLEKEQLSFYSEYQKVITLIKQIRFRLNL